MIVGEDPASQVYVRGKHKACEEAGMRSVHHGLGAGTAESELLELVAALNGDDDVDGILVQLPVPEQIDPDRIVTAIDPGKDVDGLTPVNAGLLAHGMPGLVPCTPSGVMELLRHEGVDLEGAEAVVVGRSKLVGVPVARLLLAANATVTVCHSRTRDLAAVCRRADVLVAAVGSPRLLGADAVKPGAVVIDVGINRTDDGLCRRRRLRGRARGRLGDHPGARRCRPDDDRDAAREHAGRCPRPRCSVASTPNPTEDDMDLTGSAR